MRPSCCLSSRHGPRCVGAREPVRRLIQASRRDCLTLLDIVRSRLPAAELAFLSACHTAQMTDGSIADEALYLTAAMQYCGFRSVVGKMWVIANMDERDFAEHFYVSMFLPKGKASRRASYEKSAEALRDALQRLRKEMRARLERGVNFVHYGARSMVSVRRRPCGPCLKAYTHA